MKRRSFLATLATYPVFVRSNGFTQKVLPKITSVSVETEFQLTTVFTSGTFEYNPPPPPKSTIKVFYDDGSIRHFESPECVYSYDNSLNDGDLNVHISDRELVIKIPYSVRSKETGTDTNRSVVCTYKGIKEL